MAAQGTVNNWTYNNAAISLINDHRYTVVAKALDNAGNTGTSSTVQFVYDVKAPTTTVTSPVSPYMTSLSAISGSVSDNPASSYSNPSGVSTTGVLTAVKLVGTGWWNGTTFGATDPDYAYLTVANSTTSLPNAVERFRRPPA